MAVEISEFYKYLDIIETLQLNLLFNNDYLTRIF